jgi:hypothetical protein
MPGATVKLYAWPPGNVLLKLKPGQNLGETLLATATASSAGAYSLSVSPGALRPDANAAGYVNLEVDSGTASWMFPVVAANPVPVTANLTGASPALCDEWRNYNRQPNKPATVGVGYIAKDGHTAGDTYTFYYGTDQSSSLGVAITSAGGSGGYVSFSDNGTSSVSGGFGEDYPPQTKPSSVLDRTLFVNELQWQGCRARAGAVPAVPGSKTKHKWKAPPCPADPGSPSVSCNWRVMAIKWWGGAILKTIKGVPRLKYCAPQPKNSNAHTYNQTATNLQLGFSIPLTGFGVSAQTGFDTNAEQLYHFGTRGKICGNSSDGPANSGTLASQ